MTKNYDLDVYESPIDEIGEAVLLSEDALAVDWLKKEEEEAWGSL